ncbi:hypothetical protein [Testudinid alphaherpesvirus 3]|nr:hypothetical protein [Testudinid alphaherpesvirus 3]
MIYNGTRVIRYYPVPGYTMYFLPRQGLDTWLDMAVDSVARPWLMVDDNNTKPCFWSTWAIDLVEFSEDIESVGEPRLIIEDSRSCGGVIGFCQQSRRRVRLWNDRTDKRTSLPVTNRFLLHRNKIATY